jgi:hypothetical protein
MRKRNYPIENETFCFSVLQNAGGNTIYNDVTGLISYDPLQTITKLRIRCKLRCTYLEFSVIEGSEQWYPLPGQTDWLYVSCHCSVSTGVEKTPFQHTCKITRAGNTGRIFSALFYSIF